MAKDKKGFVAIPRGLLEGLDAENRKLSKVEAFLYLSYHARFAKSEDVMTKVPCKRGQFVTSLRELAMAFMWSEAAVRRFLLHLVEDDYIVWTSYRRTTVITMKQLADEADIKEEEKRGDANTDANGDATSDATSDATKTLKYKNLDANSDPTSDATSDANGDANGDALTRVLYYNYLVRKKEEGNNNVSSRKAGLEKKKNLVAMARLVFEEYYAEKIDQKNKYYWTGEDAKNMQQLLQKIQFSRTQRGMSCEDEDMLNALKALLGSINDQWLLDHMKVGILNSRYNEIVAAASGRKTSLPNMEVGRIITEYDKDKFKNTKKYFK